MNLLNLVPGFLSQYTYHALLITQKCIIITLCTAHNTVFSTANVEQDTKCRKEKWNCKHDIRAQSDVGYIQVKGCPFDVTAIVMIS